VVERDHQRNMPDEIGQRQDPERPDQDRASREGRWLTEGDDQVDGDDRAWNGKWEDRQQADQGPSADTALSRSVGLPLHRKDVGDGGHGGHTQRVQDRLGDVRLPQQIEIVIQRVGLGKNLVGPTSFFDKGYQNDRQHGKRQKHYDRAGSQQCEDAGMDRRTPGWEPAPNPWRL
jgi:hypothetical protein